MIPPFVLILQSAFHPDRLAQSILRYILFTLQLWPLAGLYNAERSVSRPRQIYFDFFVSFLQLVNLVDLPFPTVLRGNLRREEDDFLFCVAT